jgi:hypothetical protein
MPASADQTGSYNSPNTLHFLYQRHRSRLQGIDHFHLRPIPSASQDAGRRESYGDKLHRIYPRELYVFHFLSGCLRLPSVVITRGNASCSRCLLPPVDLFVPMPLFLPPSPNLTVLEQIPPQVSVLQLLLIPSPLHSSQPLVQPPIPLLNIPVTGRDRFHLLPISQAVTLDLLRYVCRH